MNKDTTSHFSALRASTMNAVRVVSGTFFLLLLSSLFMLNFSSTAIAHATTTRVKIKDFPVLTANSNLYGITRGPDNALWFTEQSGNKIGRITPKGQVVEFLVPTVQAAPTYITRGPNNTLWFTEQSASKTGRVTIN